jgi:hypothetical protein
VTGPDFADGVSVAVGDKASFMPLPLLLKWLNNGLKNEVLRYPALVHL